MTLDGISVIKAVVVPWRATETVLESKTTLLVGLDTMTELVADPEETARVEEPPPPETVVHVGADPA